MHDSLTCTLCVMLQGWSQDSESESEDDGCASPYDTSDDDSEEDDPSGWFSVSQGLALAWPVTHTPLVFCEGALTRAHVCVCVCVCVQDHDEEGERHEEGASGSGGSLSPEPSAAPRRRAPPAPMELFDPSHDTEESEDFDYVPCTEDSEIFTVRCILCCTFMRPPPRDRQRTQNNATAYEQCQTCAPCS